MNREALKEMGLTDEQIDKVMASHGTVVNTTKQELSDVTSERDTLKTTLQDRDKQLNALKDIKPEELKQQIADLQAANEEKDNEHAAAMKDVQLSNAIKLALTNSVHDVDVASTLIDKEKLVIGNDGNVVGLDEQVAALKENKSYLFVQDPKPSGGPQIFAGGNPNGGTSGAVTKEQIMQEKDDVKRQEMIKQNSHLFK
ncbi:phage scaffolding protein [Mammaliicoccus sciuri]